MKVSWMKHNYILCKQISMNENCYNCLYSHILRDIQSSNIYIIADATM